MLLKKKLPTVADLTDEDLIKTIKKNLSPNQMCKFKYIFIRYYHKRQELIQYYFN